MKTGTLAIAWNEYVKRSDLQVQERAARGLPFLWMDESHRSDRLACAGAKLSSGV